MTGVPRRDIFPVMVAVIALVLVLLMLLVTSSVAIAISMPISLRKGSAPGQQKHSRRTCEQPFSYGHFRSPGVSI